MTGPTQSRPSTGRPVGPGRQVVQSHDAFPRPDTRSQTHLEDREAVRTLRRGREGPKRPAPTVDKDGWLRMPGIPTPPLALRDEVEEELSVCTDNRYDTLDVDTAVEQAVESTPQPLPQRTGLRHRRPPYVPSLSYSSSGSGERQEPAVVPPRTHPEVHLSEEGSATGLPKAPPSPLQEGWAAP